MKYVIVIPDGCADDPCPALGNRTPLQTAHLPNMDRIARTGMCGLTNNVPATLTPASDVATLSLFGYDPLEVYTGRAPLEAAALGVSLGPHDWAIRCNTVQIVDGRMVDFTAGHMPSDEGRRLIDSLRDSLPKAPLGNLSKKLELVSGVGYRNLLVYRGDEKPVLGDDLRTQPPHDIPDKPIHEYLPTGTGSNLLQIVMNWSQRVFADHPVNQARRANGQPDATQVWLWGQGRAPKISKFVERYGKRGAITSGVDLVRGVGALLGWKLLVAPGITDYLDNDYGVQGRLAVDHLEEFDLICVHVEATDEASHAGLTDEKVKTLERIDAEIVGPLLDALPKLGDWRILVAPDHRTPLTTRAHSHGAVPYCIAGTGIKPSGIPHYDELNAQSGSLAFDPGWTLMRWFLES